MRTQFKPILLLAILITAPLLLSVINAQAQSFSCAKAGSSAEFAICNNEDLLVLDEKLASIYYLKKSNISTAPQRQEIVREQNRWIAQRNSCKLDWTCLRVRYNDRIRQLSRRKS